MADRAGGRHPVGSGRHRARTDRDLAEERDGRAVVVRALIDAVTPAEPSVAEQDRPTVRAVRQEVGDVVGLYLKGRGVGREARSQLEVADAPTIEERLVDAARGGVQTGRSLGALVLVVDLELVSEDVHRSFSGREWFGFVWLDPSRLPVGGLEQSGLERDRVGPRRCARLGPDANPPRRRLSRPQRLERPRNEHVVRGFESSRPTIAEFDFVGALFHRAGGQPPRQPWSGLVDPECRSVQVFDAQPVGEVHLERSIRSTLFALNNNLYTRSKFVRIRILLALSGAGEVCVHCTSGRRGATASRGGLQ